MTKRELPKSIQAKMNLYRKGLICLPIDYVEFHKKLAEESLKEFPVIVHRQYMGPDGWCDGMRVLYAIIEERSGKLKKIHWHDGNQTFFEKSHKGGSFNYKKG